jgi:putative DNA primase/helicase
VRAPEDLDLDKLAKLEPVEYERLRKDAANKLGMRVTTLDREVESRRRPAFSGMVSIKPWDKPVDGRKLLEELYKTLKQHMVMSGEGMIGVTLWIVHAYAHDAFDFSPFLDIYSPLPRCGKTRLLNTIGMLVPKPLSSSNLTSAVVFRAIEMWHPTLLIDEADTFFAKNEELRGILNSGHDRRSAYTLRCEGEERVPRQFSTWAPKAIAIKGQRLHATLEDRSVIISLRRKLKSEKVEPLPHDLNAYDDVRRRCARWVADNLETLKTAKPKLPATLNDRANNHWAPLFAIADACAGEWPKDAREAAQVLSPDEDQEVGVMLLQDLRDLFNQAGENLKSTTIAARLANMEDRPWPEYSYGKPITPRQIANLLEPFKIKPKQVRLGHDRANGYTPEQFKHVFKAYLDES